MTTGLESRVEVDLENVVVWNAQTLKSPKLLTGNTRFGTLKVPQEYVLHML